MAVCNICGLPSDLCVCKEISKEQQRIRVRTEVRKWGKEVTIIEGIDEKEFKLSDIATKLKSLCACGGTVKNKAIVLQGNHRAKAKFLLVKLGFPEARIEVQ
jgi:translation initiation factor 1